MIPGIENQKTDGNLGVSSNTDRILAIIAPCEKGTASEPTPCTNPDDALATFGVGPLTAAADYILNVAGKPVVLIRGSASTAGAYGALDLTGVTGTSVVTAGAPVPLDDFDVLLDVAAGGTIGVAGIMLRYSFDGGKNYSAPQALGTAATYAIPGVGVGFAFAAGTLITNDKVKVTTSAPQLTTGDLATSLDALYNYDGEWLRALVVAKADATILGQLDLFARRFWPLGKNPEVITNTRPRAATGETEAQYLTAMAVITGAVQSAEVTCATDQCEMVIQGRRTRRPVSFPYAARLMAIDDSQDAAAVADGALPGVYLTTSFDKKNYHDETLSPGLDGLGLTTLRSWRGRPRRPGSYINNPRVLAGALSDYQFFQLSAIVNRVIEDVHALLESKLSSNVVLNEKGNIDGDVATALEEAVTSTLRAKYVDTSPARVSRIRLTLSRTDDLLTNGGVIGYKTEVQPLGVIKKFYGKTRLVKALTT